MTEDGQRDEWMVGLEGAFNLRDLGGWPCAQGGVVRRGLLWRADGPGRLTAADRATVAGLSIGDVIDLRSGVEAEHGTWVSAPTTRRHHFAVIDVMPDGTRSVIDGEPVTAVTLGMRYLRRLERGADQFVGAANVVIANALDGVLFHCAAGKDRTGILAAMLLETLGVSRADVIADYAISDAAMIHKIAHQRADPQPGDIDFDQLPPVLAGAPAEAMSTFLDLCDEHHGGIATFFADHGVAHADIARFRDEMVVPSLVGRVGIEPTTQGL